MLSSRLLENDFIDPEMEAHYAFYSSVNTLYNNIHCHDFYEVFLITKGSVYHLVNGARVLLAEGSLVFIRAADTHCYAKNGEQEVSLINLAFSRKTLEDLFTYLKADFTNVAFLKSDLPSVVILSPAEKHYVQSELEKLSSISYNQKLAVRFALRVIVADLIIRYFLTINFVPSAKPLWLEQLCTAMQTPANFIEGHSAMLRLTGRSSAYLSRAFKKYLGFSPTEFINNLRLEYSVNLLVYSDKTILTIVFEAGFDNISHYYRLFKHKYSLSPVRFRKIFQKNLINPALKLKN